MEIISRKEAKEKGLKRYFTGKPCKHGHVSERLVSKGVCTDCKKEYSKSTEKREYDKRYREENKKYYKEYMKNYYQENKDQIKDNVKKYSSENMLKIKEYREKYKPQKNKIRRLRRVSDHQFKTSEICRKILKRTLLATNSTKDTRAYEMLGYCNEELKESIESKFLEGMSWESYGGWHIDHIYPVSRYVKEGVECPATINSLSNLIPMWAEHNLEKSDRTLEEYLEDRKDLVELYGRFL